MKKRRANFAEWYEFIDSFLDIVELSCKEILEPKHTEKFGEIKIKYANHLGIAIIYNLKHAIELIIKTFIQEIKGNELNKEDRIHNLDTLFDKFKKETNIEKLKEKSNELKPNNVKDTIIHQLKGSGKNKKPPFENNIETIKNIVKHYHNLEFIDKNMINIDFSLNDTKNTYFKYPENKIIVTGSIDYFDLIYGNKIDVERILEDVKNLKSALGGIKFIFINLLVKKS